MSSCHTHMLIGAVSGLALGRTLEAMGIGPALGLDATIAHTMGHSGAGWASLAGSGLPLVALSAILATIPDIDEAGSFIARRAEAVMTLAGACLAVFAAYAARLSPAAWVIAALIGVVVGWIAAYAALRFIRRAAGGHRRLTHSLLLALVFALAAFGLWWRGFGAWALIPGALAWSIVIHDLGDICTPAGLPLLYPLSSRPVRVLPDPICRFGEPIAALVASIAGLLLLGVVHF